MPEKQNILKETRLYQLNNWNKSRIFSLIYKRVLLVIAFVISCQNIQANEKTIQCNLIETERDNIVKDVRHLEYHYDLIINLEQNKIIKFIPPQKFFNESQIYDDILVNTDNENQNEFNFSRVATNNRYPHQENLYSYSLTDNMQFLDVVVTQFDISSIRTQTDRYSRKYECKKKN
jgi:hypothetical protein